MIIYNPMFDAKHCAYRFLSTMHIIGDVPVQWDVFKIIDILRTYPSLILEIRPFPKKLQRVKKSLKQLPVQYTVPKNPRKTLYQVQPIHNLVINWLIAKGFISRDRFSEGYVERATEAPAELVELFTQDQVISASWFHYLVVDLPAMGKDDFSDFKERAGYLEHRYDPK